MTASSGDALALRPLGSTGLMVHPLCIGCAPLGDMPETFAYSVAEAQALETFRAVLDGPVNFLDTAAAYGDGESERRLGLVLRERGGRVPPGFVIATKADRNLQTGDFSGAQIRRSVEASLRRLGLERLQLCYLHDPEHTTFEASMAAGGAVEALRRCKEEGLVAHLGIAGGPIPMMTRYVETGLFEAAISHNRYTLLNTSAAPFWDACVRHCVAAVNAAPYGSGILAKGPGVYPRYAYQDAPAEVVERARRLQDVCERHRVPLGAAALQFSLRDPRIVSTVVGISRPERLAQTLKWARWPIAEGLWGELAAVVRPDTVDPEAARWR
jgi:D-threo-aldose 1-dehydrogenase